MSFTNKVLTWLLKADPAIRWQVMRDLQDCPHEQFTLERAKIAHEGWGARLLAKQDKNTMWASGLYSPKWTSTTYTMLLLRRMGLEPRNTQAQAAAKVLLEQGFYKDGGINFFPSFTHSETCVTGMILSLLAYFQIQDERVVELVKHLLRQQMSDGGWNCNSYKGAHHSSLHTTISVLEGLREFQKTSDHQAKAICEAQAKAHEFLFIHRLFRSDHTGDIIDVRMTRFSFPPRWHYDVLRALDYLQEVHAAFDKRMQDALELLKKKQSKDGTWKLQNKHPGRTYFELEQVAKPSRWNTLRALRVLRFYHDF